MDIQMFVGPDCTLIEKAKFRTELMTCIQLDHNVNTLLLKFLMDKKDEILSLMEMLKR